MEQVWAVSVQTWAMTLMWPVDAKEAVRLGDYVLAPVGGYDPPTPPDPVRQTAPRPGQAA